MKQKYLNLSIAWKYFNIIVFKKKMKNININNIIYFLKLINNEMHLKNKNKNVIQS